MIFVGNHFWCFCISALSSCRTCSVSFFSTVTNGYAYTNHYHLTHNHSYHRLSPFHPRSQIPPCVNLQHLKFLLRYAELFSGLITPDPNAVFSPLQFSRTIDENNFPINPVIEFNNPIAQIIGSFSYNNMLDGAQWSAVWYRLSDSVMLCYETKPWNGGTGGYGYTDCQPDSDAWLPGEYEVQIFIGEEWNGIRSVLQLPVIQKKPSNTPSLTPDDNAYCYQDIKHSTSTSTRTQTLTSTSFKDKYTDVRPIQLHGHLLRLQPCEAIKHTTHHRYKMANTK